MHYETIIASHANTSGRGVRGMSRTGHYISALFDATKNRDAQLVTSYPFSLGKAGRAGGTPRLIQSKQGDYVSTDHRRRILSLMAKRWIPLEANPDVLNKFAAKLGLDTNKVAFCDIFGLEEELLAFVPQPVYAVLLLFPVTEQLDKEAAKVDEEQQQKGVTPDPSIFYMKQTISNACGTIGVLHAVGNNQKVANIRSGSFFQQFFDMTTAMDPPQRGAFLESPPPEAPRIEEAHAEAAMEGDTTPELDEDVTPHFVALVNHNNRLLELDGRKSFPVDHGQTTQETLLQDAAVVARKFMDRTDSINFNMLALATPEDAA